MIQEDAFLNQPVRSLQTMLRMIGTNQGTVSTLIPDGIYGPQTERAVRSFQRAAGLPATGVADLDTWQRIVWEFERARINQMQAAPLSIILQPNQTILAGQRNGHLYFMQGMMMALSDAYDNMPKLQATGVHDAESQQAVRFLQGRTNLPANGCIDKSFYALLVGLYRSAIGDGILGNL